MFIIAEIAGKQYHISEKDKLVVDKFTDKKEGDKIVTDRVLLCVADDNKEVEIGKPYLPYTVELKVLGHKKGEKVRIFKMKSKTRYAKTKGHRQQYTEVEVIKINKAGEKTAVKEEKVQLKEKKVLKKAKAAVKKAVKKTKAKLA